MSSHRGLHGVLRPYAAGRRSAGAYFLPMPAARGGAFVHRVDLDSRPMLVFWESTKACGLACRHCRATAVATPHPNELTTAQATQLIESLAAFGKPRPVLIATGGDVLMRHDLDELAALDRMERDPAPRS